MQDCGMNRATREAGRSNDKEKKMGQNEKMKGKDYIACGILSLMNMVGMLVAAVIEHFRIYSTSLRSSGGILYRDTLCDRFLQGA